MKKKYLMILAGLLIIGLVGVLGFWFFSPQMRQARQLKNSLESFNKALKTEEQKYINDTYGGTTPEETYRLFLEALKKQDIDLASKYFILDKQGEYKKLLDQVKGSDQWKIMMEDLLDSRNSKGRMIGDSYVIEVVNKDNVSVTTIIIKKPVLSLGSERKEIGNLWKITQF
jgi:transposase